MSVYTDGAHSLLPLSVPQSVHFTAYAGTKNTLRSFLVEGFLWMVD